MDVTPPPVQGIMIASAVSKEWTTLPSGQDLQVMYGEHINLINAEADIIRAEEPAYSQLVRLYGYETTREANPEAMNAANALHLWVL